MNKLPPIEKVYEAWSALADGRVSLQPGALSATVESSDGERTYTVNYDPAADTYASNDNATFWRGYPGYPVLAMMMLTGRLPYDPDFTARWAGINWNALNRQHRRDYAAAAAAAEQERGIDPEAASARAQQAMDALAVLPAKVKRLKA